MVVGVLTLSEDDDVRLANLIDFDLVHVTGLFGRRRRDARQRRGADRLAQAPQVPLGHQAHHQDLVLVAEVIVEVANLTARHNHLAPCHQSKTELIQHAHDKYSACKTHQMYGQTTLQRFRANIQENWIQNY